jgi:hypothetical protein
MNSIRLRATVDAQGKVMLEMPLELANQEVDLVVVFETVAHVPPTPEKMPIQGWPPGFFEQVAGGWQGEPLRREYEGDYEQREPFK